MYNINLQVKYKQIEKDLKEKYMDSNDEDYSQENIEIICNELYKHEYLLAFECGEEYNETIINTIVEELWQKMKNYEPFLQTFSLLKEKKEKSNPVFNDDFIQFCFLFSFEYFDKIHPCICDFLKNGIIDSLLLNTLLKD
jgi:hypothetical protein